MTGWKVVRRTRYGSVYFNVAYTLFAPRLHEPLEPLAKAGKPNLIRRDAVSIGDWKHGQGVISIGGAKRTAK